MLLQQGYVPATYGRFCRSHTPSDVAELVGLAGHYVENTGNSTLRFLEIFKTGEPGAIQSLLFSR